MLMVLCGFGVEFAGASFFGGNRMPQPPPNYEGKEFYKVLGVLPDAKPEEIRRQFRRLAKRHHPDMQGAKDLSEADTKANTEKFKAITEAYQVLSDSDKRKEYDLHRANPSSSFGGRGGFPGGGGFPFPPGFEQFMRPPRGSGGGPKKKKAPSTTTSSKGKKKGVTANREEGDVGEGSLPGSFDEFLRREFGDSFFAEFEGTGHDDEEAFRQTEEEMAKYTRDGGEGSEKNLYRDANRRVKERDARHRAKVRDTIKEGFQKMAQENSRRSNPGNLGADGEDDREDAPVSGVRVPKGVDHDMLFSMRGGASSQQPKATRHAPPSAAASKLRSKRPDAPAAGGAAAGASASWFPSLFGNSVRKGAPPASASAHDDPLAYYAATDEELAQNQRARDRLKWAQLRQQKSAGSTSQSPDKDDEEVDASEMTDEEVDAVIAELALREMRDDAEIDANSFTTSEEKATLRRIKAAERERKAKRLKAVIMAKQRLLQQQESEQYRQRLAEQAAKSAEERRHSREEAFDRSKLFGTGATTNAGSTGGGSNSEFEEVEQEDMSGQKRIVRRRRKSASRPAKNDPSSFGGDPLEAAYSEEQPTAANTGDQQRSSSAYIIPDTTDSSESDGPPSPSSAERGRRRKGPDPDPFDHLHTKGDSIPKPRTKTEKDMMGWAYEMAKRMGQTVPKGVDPTRMGKMSAKEAAEEIAKSGVDPLTGEKLKPGQKPTMPSAKTSPPKTKKKSPESQTPNANRKPTTTTSSDSPTNLKRKGKSASSTPNVDFSKAPDMHTKPTREQMDMMEKIFGDPNDAGMTHEDVISSDRPLKPDAYQKIFKSGKPPTEEELKAMGAKPPVAQKRTRKASAQASATPSPAPAPDTEPKGDDADRMEPVTAETFTKYCGAPDKEVTGKQRSCVFMFTSATSKPALARTILPTSKRYPISTKTFFVTRPEVEGVVSFLFERVRAAFRAAGKTEPPIELKDAMCRTYTRSTTSNAGEICAIVIRDGGLSMQVVGRQRLDNYDIPVVIKDRLEGVVSGAVAPPSPTSSTPPRGSLKGAPMKFQNSIVRGRDAEALVYLPIKRGTLPWINQFD